MAGEISWVYVWNRLLTRHERVMLGHAPYSFLRPVRPRPLYRFFPSAGPPPSSGTGVIVFTTG
jgi:hypothetical protein